MAVEAGDLPPDQQVLELAVGLDDGLDIGVELGDGEGGAGHLPHLSLHKRAMPAALSLEKLAGAQTPPYV